MINLHLGIYQGEIEIFEFGSMPDLVDYINYNLSEFDCVWLVANDAQISEIMITENIDNIFDSLLSGLFDYDGGLVQQIHIQEYQTYEDAYAVALSMREPNPKCYN